MRVWLLICMLLPRALVAFSTSYRPAFTTRLGAEPPRDPNPQFPDPNPQFPTPVEMAPEPKVPESEDSVPNVEESKLEEQNKSTSEENEKEPKMEEPNETTSEANEETTLSGDLGDFPFAIKDAFGNNDGQEVLFEFLGTAGSIAVDVLKGLRWAAANVLTASLPQNERLDMIASMEPNLLVASRDREDDFVVTTQGSSVSENIAAAAAAESRRLEKWEEEKIEITKQAEKAATERVAAEIAIQQQRSEQEQGQLKEQLEKAQKTAEQTAVVEMEARALEQAKAEKDREELAALERILLEKETQATKDKQELGEISKELFVVKAAQKAKGEELQAIKKAQEEQEAELKAIKEAAPPPAGDTPSAPAPPRLGDVELRRYSSIEYEALSDEDKANLRELRDQNPKWMENVEKSDSHSILGPIVADLGYKRLHFLSAGKLGTIPIWEKQRIYRNNRAKSMAKDKMKNLNLGFPGAICLHEDTDGKLCIIDGQHRIGMMAQLRDIMKKQEKNADAEGSTKSDGKSLDFDRILVEVYPQLLDLENHKRDLFLEINKAEPVKLLDMPGVAKAADRNVITAAVDKLEETYPNMFSPSQRCRVPNVNIDNLRNSLFAADVKTRHSLTTAKKLYDWLLEQNEIVGKKFTDDKEQDLPSGWKKASENKFYLGLESTWLYK